MRPLVERLRQVVERGDADVGSRNLAMMAEAADRVEALETRLELTATGGDGKPWPLDIGDCDGIGCRDETIKLQERNCETLRAVRTELESKLDPLENELAVANKLLLARERDCALAESRLEAERNLALEVANEFGKVQRELDAALGRLGKIRELTEAWSAADTHARLQDVLNEMAAVAWEGVENVEVSGRIVEKSSPEYDPEWGGGDPLRGHKPQTSETPT